MDKTSGNEFSFKCADFIPFKDKEVIDRVRKIHGQGLTKHSNPDFKINIIPDALIENILSQTCSMR